MKLSKEKQTKLILVAIGTVAVVAGLWYVLIRAQTAALTDVANKIEAAKNREAKMDNSVKLAGKIQSELDLATAELTEIQTGMASGDLYSWMYNTIKDFKASYRVDIPQFSAVEPSDCTLIHKFPFKQVKMTVSGNGYFHDVGRFVADLENRYQQIRVQSLEMAPSGATSDRERLSFRMEIVALTKTTEPSKP